MAFTPNEFDLAISVSIGLSEEPMLGDLTLTSLTIDIPEADTSHVWDANVASCSAVALASAEDPDFDWIYYRIDISCSEPALPTGDNPGEPLELGDFVIVTFFSAG